MASRKVPLQYSVAAGAQAEEVQQL
jgi:hypothetical protein